MFQRILTFFLLLAVAACSPGGGSRDLPPDLGEGDGPGDAPVVIQGRVVKGVMRGALVEAREIEGSGSSGGVIGFTRTDVNGYYRMELPADRWRTRVMLQVHSDFNTLIRCDLPGGCNGGVAWGEEIALNQPEFVAAVIPELGTDNRVNINALTSMAARRALLQRQLTASGIRQVNSQLLSRFNVAGNTLDLPVIDLTSETEVKQASVRQLLLSTLNAAVLDAAVAQYGLTMEASWAQLKARYAEAGFADLDPDTAEVDIEAVILRQLAIAGYVGERFNRGVSVASELRARLALLRLEGSSARTAGTGSATADATALAQTKSLMQEIRRIYSAVGLAKLLAITDIQKLTNGEALNALEAFDMDVSILTDGHPGLTATQRGVTASVSAFFNVFLRHYIEGASIPASYEGIDVIADAGANRFTMTVSQVYSACTEEQLQDCVVELNLSLEANFARQPTGAAPVSGTTSVFMTDTTFRLTGTATTGNFTLGFPETPVNVEFDELGAVIEPGSDDQTDESRGSITVDTDNLELNLPVQLTYLEDDQPKRLDLIVIGELGKLALTNADSRNLSQNDDGILVQEQNATVFYEMADVTLNLVFVEDPETAAATTVINLSQTTPLPVEEFRFVSRTNSLCRNGLEAECEELFSETVLEGEADESYLGLAAAILNRSVLEGFNTPVTVWVTGERIGPSVNDISSLQAAYPGHGLDLKGQFNNTGGIVALQGENLDGTRIDLTSNGGDRGGHVFAADGTPYARLRDMGEWIKIIYSDGSFEAM